MDNYRKVEKIVVIGAGIVGIPMAAALADARVKIASEIPAEVVLVQRDSPTSGWKVEAINQGISPLGHTEPDLKRVVERSVSAGLLRATSDYAEAGDADVILICVQTDKKGLEPDYGPLLEALGSLVQALKEKPQHKLPLIIFESTLAPTTMQTLIVNYFEKSGLKNGKDIQLGNSPNRVMPGFLLERIRKSDKLIGGLEVETPELIRNLYSHIVTEGKLHVTNSVTAEIVKTLENASRDVRIAYSAEVCRFCDQHDIDFYMLRDQVNRRLSWTDTASFDSEGSKSGGMLIPSIGVGGHCLPKDGILLLWRWLAAGRDASHSVILGARYINDESPSVAEGLMERRFGGMSGRSVALMGAAYKQNSMDTRNSPALVLGRILLERGCHLTLHDPYVKPQDHNLRASGLDVCFMTDREKAVSAAEILVFCTAHREYKEGSNDLCAAAPHLKGVFDGCNLFTTAYFTELRVNYAGLGKGSHPPPQELVESVLQGFHDVENGFACEVDQVITDLNERYAIDDFNVSSFQEVKRLAMTCETGCFRSEPESPESVALGGDFPSRLVECANYRHVPES